MSQIKLIIWDWNGTLLNDVAACIEAMNCLLTHRKLALMDTDRYRKIFKFPVIEYYQALGFDFAREPFAKAAMEYIGQYQVFSKAAKLQEGAVEILATFKASGYRQIILSAMETNTLIEQINQYHLTEYFTDIIGMDNFLAKSKIENAQRFLKEAAIAGNENIILVGDTFHDFEVASAINCRCLLVRNGHQDLNQYHFDDRCQIFNDLSDIRLIKRPA